MRKAPLPNKLRVMLFGKEIGQLSWDARAGRKILTMSLAAINPEAGSYEELFRTCNKLGISEQEKSQLFRRMVFNFLASNTDDHEKNFSFTLDDDGCWHIAKAYDINFIFRTLNSAETDHCFSARGKTNSITTDDLLQFAREYGIKSAVRIIADVRAAIDTFEVKAAANGIRGDIAEIISRRLEQLKNEMDGTEIAEIQWPSFEIDGHNIESFHFEKDEKGAIRVLAVVDGVKSKKILSLKHPDYLLVAQRFNGSADSLKKRLAREYFLK